MERRLAAILAADVVGYSRLIRADEEGTLSAMSALRQDFIDPKIASYRGRIVKLMGDGMLSEFPSVVDAVRAAVEMQQAMAEYNSHRSDGERIIFRIGINLGDVVIEGDDIHGDGVNVAARLEALSKPGGICVSGGVYEQIRDRIDLAFDDLGEQQVKNIDRPVRVWSWVAAGKALSQEPGDQTTPAARPSIAVLPFDNMSGDLEQEYFSDGITEDIITALSRFHWFFVTARNSTFTYKGRAVDVKQVARELGVRYVLEGSVRKSGSRVRVTAQLIDGTTGNHVWAERYDRDLEDIFELQDEISQRIASTLVPALSRAELKRIVAKRPNDLDAWDCYLRGVERLNDFSAEGNAAAREHLGQALAIDPNYSDACAALALSYVRDVNLGFASDRVAALTEALSAAHRAVALDGASSDAHHVLSTAYLLSDQPDMALAEARVSVELNPNDAQALHALGNKSDLMGDPEGIPRMVRAQQLDPQSTDRHALQAFLARAYVNARDYEKAIAIAQSAIRSRPEYPNSHFILAIALAHMGRADEAKAAMARAEALSPGFLAGRADWAPYADPDSNRHLQEGMHKATAEA
jgi:adenylate cyclase